MFQSPTPSISASQANYRLQILICHPLCAPNVPHRDLIGKMARDQRLVAILAAIIHSRQYFLASPISGISKIFQSLAVMLAAITRRHQCFRARIFQPIFVPFKIFQSLARKTHLSQLSHA